MLTYSSVWSLSLLCGLFFFLSAGSDLVSALVWAEVVWVCVLVVVGINLLLFCELPLLFFCVILMCLSAVELAILVSLVSLSVEDS